MKFNIIMDDGGMYVDCLVLVSRGMAETKRDIHINMKYEGGICICNKHFRNYWIEAKYIYDIEPIEKKKEISPNKDLDNVVKNKLISLT